MSAILRQDNSQKEEAIHLQYITAGYVHGYRGRKEEKKLQQASETNEVILRDAIDKFMTKPRRSLVSFAG